VDPPVVDPLVVDPPVVDPLVVDPLVVDPLVVDPPVVDPPVVDPPVVDPPVVDPPVVIPAGSPQPNATKITANKRISGLPRGRHRTSRHPASTVPSALWRAQRAFDRMEPVRRSELLKVSVFCPHFKRSVLADKNATIDRLVACAESDHCREPSLPTGTADHARPYPHGCPVYPQLAK
jgi:hypothetical protein